MTPRTKRRTSIFPAYSPLEKENPTPDEWAEHIGQYIGTIAKRVVAVGSILATLAGGGAYASHVNEAKPVDAATVRIKALEDSVSLHARLIAENATLSRSILYISCETLRRVQPPTALPPQECR